jgi:hypothetical protein
MKIQQFGFNDNKLVDFKMDQNPSMYFQFTFQHDIQKQCYYLNVRQFKNTESYSGPTKNGFRLTIQDDFELERLQDHFNKLFDEAKKAMEEQ